VVQGPNDQILVTIQITIQIQEFFRGYV